MALWLALRTIFRPTKPANPPLQAAVRARDSLAAGEATMVIGAATRRLTLQEQFSRLRGFVEAATLEAEAVQRAHVTARERLDATELSLRRMLSEIEDVMLVRPMASLAAPVVRADVGVSRLALAA